MWFPHEKNSGFCIHYLLKSGGSFFLAEKSMNEYYRFFLIKMQNDINSKCETYTQYLDRLAAPSGFLFGRNLRQNAVARLQQCVRFEKLSKPLEKETWVAECTGIININNSPMNDYKSAGACTILMEFCVVGYYYYSCIFLL